MTDPIAAFLSILAERIQSKKKPLCDHLQKNGLTGSLAFVSAKEKAPELSAVSFKPLPKPEIDVGSMPAVMAAVSKGAFRPAFKATALPVLALAELLSCS